jgi:hypothetical protein
MKGEYDNLRELGKIIDVPMALAKRRRFSCVLTTEYVHGKPIYVYMKREDGLYDKLTSIAHLLRKLHDDTK